MKKFSELQVNDYIFECCDDFPRMTVAYRITSINKGSTQTILLMKEFGKPECIRGRARALEDVIDLISDTIEKAYNEQYK